MLFHTLVLAFAGLAAAQSFNSASDCCDVNTGSIDPAEISSWCRAQRNSCPEICGGQVADGGNTCDTTKLTFNCTCFDTSLKPNISDFAQTLPSLMCDEWVTQCVAAHPNDLDGQTICHSVACGTKNASAVQGSSSSATTSGSASSSSGSSPTSSGGSSSGSGAAATSPAPSQSGAAVAMQVGQEYGTGLVGAALFALFGLAL